jgi:diacylglycerol O-acyltransferase
VHRGSADTQRLRALLREAYEAYKRERFRQIASRGARKPSERNLRNVLEALKQQYDSSVHLATAMRRFGLAFVGRSGNLAVPWHNVPRTSINTRVSGARRFVAQSFEFERVKRDSARPWTPRSTTSSSPSVPAPCAATC